MLYPVQRQKWWFHSAVEHTALLWVSSGSSQSLTKKKKCTTAWLLLRVVCVVRVRTAAAAYAQQLLLYLSEKLLIEIKSWKLSLLRKGVVFDTVVSGWITGDPLSGLHSQLRSPSMWWMLYPVQLMVAWDKPHWSPQDLIEKNEINMCSSQQSWLDSWGSIL